MIFLADAPQLNVQQIYTSHQITSHTAVSCELTVNQAAEKETLLRFDALDGGGQMTWIRDDVHVRPISLKF